jgi:hypothetical protein
MLYFSPNQVLRNNIKNPWIIYQTTIFVKPSYQTKYQCYNGFMSPHNYQMKFNGYQNQTIKDQYTYYSTFNGVNVKKSVSFVPRFFGRVRAMFNKTNRHYEGAQKTPELSIDRDEFWRDLGRP